MYTTVSKQRRPSTDINFWSSKINGSADYSNYVSQTYLSTGRLQKSESILSDDKLELTTTVQWNSEEDYNAFRSDNRVLTEFLDPFNSYAEQHGIVVSSVDAKNNMVAIQGPDPYPNLVIPDTWANVEEFADWWFRNGMPIKFQEGAEVFLSDDATSIALFRKGRFQVELYLIHPHPTVPLHEHPNVNVIKARLDGKKYPYLSNTLHNGEAHGAGLQLEAEDKGYPLVAIQHWLTRDPTTIASMWKGNTVGPKQESLIRRFNPDAYISNGYADITRGV